MIQESGKAIKPDDIFDSYSITSPTIRQKSLKSINILSSLVNNIKSPIDVDSNEQISANHPSKTVKPLTLQQETKKLNYIANLKKITKSSNSLFELNSTMNSKPVAIEKSKKMLNNQANKNKKVTNGLVSAKFSPFSGKVRMKIETNSDDDDEEDMMEEGNEEDDEDDDA